MARADLKKLLEKIDEADQIVLYDQRGSDSPLSTEEHITVLAAIKAMLKAKQSTSQRGDHD